MGGVLVAPVLRLGMNDEAISRRLIGQSKQNQRWIFIFRKKLNDLRPVITMDNTLGQILLNWD